MMGITVPLPGIRDRRKPVVPDLGPDQPVKFKVAEPWLSEQINNNSARIAGNYACSASVYNGVHLGDRFRAVFRP